jgi:hypothetical protein
MAKGKSITITRKTTNNKTDSAVSTSVEAVVVNSVLVADAKSTNPGVVSQGTGYCF